LGPPTGGGPVTKLMAQMRGEVVLRVRHGSTAADATGICWAARCLYSDGDHQRFHRRNTGPGSEAAPPGWARPGAERGSVVGLEAFSCQSASGPPERQ